MTPLRRESGGAFQSFSVEFVDVKKLIPLDIYGETGVYPTHELRNLEPKQFVGVFHFDGTTSLSPDLGARERLAIQPLLDVIKKVGNTTGGK